jgi:hypothetical protein
MIKAEKSNERDEAITISLSFSKWNWKSSGESEPVECNRRTREEFQKGSTDFSL